MKEVDALGLLLQGCPSKEAALVLNNSIRFLMERYYQGKQDVGKHAALDYILLIKHADRMTRAAALIDEDKVEARNVWIELKRVWQTISFLRSYKNIFLEDSYRLPGFTGEVIGRVLGNIELTSQLEATKNQVNALTLLNQQVQDQELKQQAERKEKERLEKLEQITNGKRGGEHNSRKAKRWQCVINPIVKDVLDNNEKRVQKQSLSAMEIKVRSIFNKSESTIQDNINLPKDPRQLIAYIKTVREEQSKTGKSALHSA